jgi:hypothetical protein
MSPQVWGILGIAVNAAIILIGIGQMKGELKRIWKDFPPHRHVNGKVLYPADYEPTDIERLGGVH